MSLKQKTIKGFIWNFSGTIGGGVINFCFTMILARLLSPTDFGLLELLIIFTSVSSVFVESGFSRAIIRDKEVTQTDLSSVFYVNVLIAVVIYIILFFAAPGIARFFSAESLVPLSRVVFLTIIFEALALVQTSNLSRQLNFKPYAQASIIAMTIAGIVAVVMALNGYGVWALAVNMVSLSVIRTSILWFKSGWLPSLQFSSRSISKYLNFGGNLLAQGIIDRIVTNLESFFIGRIYTKGDLGMYSQSKKLDSYVVSRLAAVIETVTYPSLAKLEGESLKQGYRNVLGVSMFVMIPISFFIFVTAENFMVTIFGDQWLEAAKYLRILAITGFMVSLYGIFINIFMVKGRANLLFRISLVRHLLRIIFVLILAKISIMAMLYGIVFVTTLSALAYVYFGGKLIGYSIVEVAKDLGGLFLISSASSVAVYFVGIIMSGFSMSFIFLIQLFVMGSLYLALNYMTKNRTYQEVISIVKSVTRR